MSAEKNSLWLLLFPFLVR